MSASQEPNARPTRTLESQLIGGEEYAHFLYQADGARKPEFQPLDETLGIDKIKDLPELKAHIFAFGGDRANASPQIAMMNTLFLREHNRLAGELERLNSGWDDERVFQTARNIIIVTFIKIVIEECINHIAPTPFRLRADSKIATTAPWNRPNWITTEFSLLYRWHSLVPDTVTWNGQSYRVGLTFLNNKLLTAIGLARAFIEVSAQNPRKARRTQYRRTTNTDRGQRHKPGRVCDVGPYVSYRDYVKLSPVTKFEEISKDAGSSTSLGHSTRTTQEGRFYVGLFCEDTVANSPLPPLILKLVAVDAFSQALQIRCCRNTFSFPRTSQSLDGIRFIKLSRCATFSHAIFPASSVKSASA